MNSIINIDERNLQATVQPGVINQVFRNAVENKGLFYPPDPAVKEVVSRQDLAENTEVQRHFNGVTKDYMLNLEVVLPDGEIIWTGANVLKIQQVII